MTQPEKPDHEPHATTYFVNGEEEHTTEKELPVSTILETAGFTPYTDYTLSSENPPKDYTSYTQQVHIHEKERFTARFTGPTPTS